MSCYQWNPKTKKWEDPVDDVKPVAVVSKSVPKSIAPKADILAVSKSIASAEDIVVPDSEDTSCSSNSTNASNIAGVGCVKKVEVSPSPVVTESSSKDSDESSDVEEVKIDKKVKVDPRHEWLTNFYKKHNPTKIDDVSSTLEKYEGREEKLFGKIEKKYGIKVPEAVKNPPAVDLEEEEDDDDDDYDPFDDDSDDDLREHEIYKSSSKSRRESIEVVEKSTKHRFAHCDSMRLIPDYDSDEDDDDDSDIKEENEAEKLTRSIAQSYHANMFMKVQNKSIRDLSSGGRLSFGVPEEPHTTTQKLKTGKLKKKIKIPKRDSDLSFDEQVELNHVHSFKHELSEREQEEVWYTDVEMVIMKVDCGLFNKAAQNSGKKQQEQVNAQRRQKINKQNTTPSGFAKKDDAKAKQMRKKYGIDKKVKDKNAAASSSKSKKKGMFGFGKKK